MAIAMTNSKKDSNTEDYKGFRVHSKSVCTGYCPFHNPSDHPLKDAEIHIRGDKRMLVERICEHGVGHDDPDSVAYFHSKGEMWAGVHGCDGCCTVAPKDSELESILNGIVAPEHPWFDPQKAVQKAVQAITSKYITKEESDRRVLEARIEEQSRALQYMQGWKYKDDYKRKIAELRELLKGDKE